MAGRNSPIGVFDSGVGGISVLGRLTQILPAEDFIYYGDLANAPYGTKTVEAVRGCVDHVMDTLLSMDVKAVVIACNTATSVAAAALRETYTLPIIGMEPALKPASMLRRNGSILVMATPVTLSLPKFRRLYDAYGEGAISVPCPGLMECVERGDDTVTRAYLERLFSGYDMDHVDAIVLGCTHYVFLRPLLSQILPAHITMVDGNAGTAAQLARVLQSRELTKFHGTGSVRFLSSAASTEHIQVMQKLYAEAVEIAKDGKYGYKMTEK